MALYLGNTEIKGVAIGDAAVQESLAEELNTQNSLIAQFSAYLDGEQAPVVPDIADGVSYKSELRGNNADLVAIFNKVKSLPDTSMAITMYTGGTAPEASTGVDGDVYLVVSL